MPFQRAEPGAASFVAVDSVIGGALGSVEAINGRLPGADLSVGCLNLKDDNMVRHGEIGRLGKLGGRQVDRGEENTVAYVEADPDCALGLGSEAGAFALCDSYTRAPVYRCERVGSIEDHRYAWPAVILLRGLLWHGRRLTLGLDRRVFRFGLGAPGALRGGCSARFARLDLRSGAEVERSLSPTSSTSRTTAH